VQSRTLPSLWKRSFASASASGGAGNGVRRYVDTGGNSLSSLSQLDFVFAIDVTHSMVPFVHRAGEVAIDIVQTLSKKSAAE